MNKDDVLKVAGEPVGYVSAENIRHLSDGEDTESTIYQTPYDDNTEGLYTEAQLLAMYAKGAEDMRERAAKLCETLSVNEMKADPTGWCAEEIRILPITPTNMEGERCD